MTELPEISALQFNPREGLEFAAGTSSGHVLLYDLRSDRPLLTKDHQYGLAMRGIAYHASGNMVTFDQKIVKIWDQTSVRPSCPPPLPFPRPHPVHALWMRICRASCSRRSSRRRT